MKTFRLIANILVAIVLTAVLAGLIINIVVNRCSKNVRDPGKIPVQEIPFKGETK
jgi:hypothetical protein